MKSQKGALVALASIPLIMTLGNSMLIPILPQISKQLNISAFQVSMIITVYGLIAIVLIPIAGYLSDRYGRKIIIMPSLLITAAGGGICVAAAWLMQGTSAYYVILAGRFLQGIGAAGAFPIVIPFIGDLFKDEKEASKGLGIIETANTFGKVISPILGAYLGLLLWFAPFIAIPILCVISFVLVMFLVKKPEKEAKPSDKKVKQFLSDIKEILKEKGRWLYAIFAIGGICMFVIFGVLFYLSEILESKYNLTGAVKGYVLAIPLALLCLASYGSGKIIGENKARMKWLGFSGMVLLGVSMLITGFSSEIYYMVGFLTLSGIGVGIVLPCMDALITKSIEKESRGTITSLYSSMRFIGVTLGPSVVSLLMLGGHWLLFGTMASLGAIGGFLTFFAVTPEKEDENGKTEEDRIKPKFVKPLLRERAR